MYDMSEWLAEHRGAEQQRLILKAQIVFSLSAGAEDRKFASSEESVGQFWLREPAEHVIQTEFGDPERPIAVRFSQSDFGFVVQTLDDAAGELLLGLK